MDVETHLSSLFDRLDEGVVCQCFTNPSRPQACGWHIGSHEQRGVPSPSGSRGNCDNTGMENYREEQVKEILEINTEA